MSNNTLERPSPQRKPKVSRCHDDFWMRTWLAWLKTQQWGCVLPLVTGGGGATPFIEIPSGDSSSHRYQFRRKFNEYREFNSKPIVGCQQPLHFLFVAELHRSIAMYYSSGQSLFRLFSPGSIHTFRANNS